MIVVTLNGYDRILPAFVARAGAVFANFEAAQLAIGTSFCSCLVKCQKF